MKLADLYSSPRGKFWIAIVTGCVLVTIYTVTGYLYFEDQRRLDDDLRQDVKREAAGTRREVKSAYERIEIRLQAAMDAINVTARDVKETVKEASRLEDVKDEYWLKWEEEKFDRLFEKIDAISDSCKESP